MVEGDLGNLKATNKRSVAFRVPLYSKWKPV